MAESGSVTVNSHAADEVVSLAERPRRNVTLASVRRTSRATAPRRTSSLSVTLRQLSTDIQDDGTFYSEVTQEVPISHHDGPRELDELDAAVIAGRKSSALPMAEDNDRFFKSEERYGPVLTAFQKKIRDGETMKVELNSEVTFLGWLWRFFIRLFLVFTNDPANRLFFGRGGLEDFLPFLASHEALALSEVLAAFDLPDDRSKDWASLKLAFSNRNTSRAMMQTFTTRYDNLYHWYTQVTNNRFFDFFSQFPYLGFLSFPATENFPSSTFHAIRAILRDFRQGTWLTRVFTSDFRGLVTTDEKTPVQNLAAEVTQFETANRNQYGTYYGRKKTNEFRFEHRLTVDESNGRTFATSPLSTLANNGAEHVLRGISKHWHNMLYQENGNFAHQRQEQLSPFETLRFHLPIVLLTLSNLRGRNTWDSRKLGPYMRRLQLFNPSSRRNLQQDDIEAAEQDDIEGPCRLAQSLLDELLVPNEEGDMIREVCGGIPSRMHPLRDWLTAIRDAIDELCKEAHIVKKHVDSVAPGIQIGYNLLKHVNWRVPSTAVLEQAVKEFIRGDTTGDLSGVIRNALQQLASKDERTLRELILRDDAGKQRGGRGQEAKEKLLERSVLLLEREIRRKALDDKIVMMSKGDSVDYDKMKKGVWYWEISESRYTIVSYKGRQGEILKLVEVDSGFEKKVSKASATFKHYIPIAESISRAQNAFLTIELEYGKKMQYNAFMEFGKVDDPRALRGRLRRLAVLSQVQCSELDKAKLNVLAEIKKSTEIRKSNKVGGPNCPPQNVIILGGGPAGLLCAIHCTTSVLFSGGKVRVYEARDAYSSEASTFERAQIVRLDSRQIGMLRYYLGTRFEDVFVPAKGETDPHLGNVIPAQGFVEVTIKRLEAMMLDVIVEMRSKDLLHYYTNSKIKVDPETKKMTQTGKNLKPGDTILLNGKSWTVNGYIDDSSLTPDDLVRDEMYDILSPRDQTIKPYRYTGDGKFNCYVFQAENIGDDEIVTDRGSFPAVYPRGKGRTNPRSIVLHSSTAPDSKKKKHLSFDEIGNEEYEMCTAHSHVLLANGKPYNSKEHYEVTTAEPYAVCCIEGIKVSLGMHNFGGKRFGVGLVDDIRSVLEQNTRIVGDFTKSVLLEGIVETMADKVNNDQRWKDHIRELPGLFDNQKSTILADFQIQINKLKNTQFERERLQTRFFELGDNYYLGMELPREFDAWKKDVSSHCLPDLPVMASAERVKNHKRLVAKLEECTNRLWYEATTDVIHSGDVYNPNGKRRMPKLYMIDSPFEEELRGLEELEEFRLSGTYEVIEAQSAGSTLIKRKGQLKPFSIPNFTIVKQLQTGSKKHVGELSVSAEFECLDRFEILEKNRGSSLARTSRGYVASFLHVTQVQRCSNLSRAPDGYSESRVALASFPVAHTVSHRTMQIRQIEENGEGFITAYIGDAQSSPHFMRYSGLTGATINCMTFGNLCAQAVEGVKFKDRALRWSLVTDWSNGEVVQRGTGANYGMDGFLRPGSSYTTLVDYLYARFAEHHELGTDFEHVLTRDWKTKLAASIVPRGLENDKRFLDAVFNELDKVVNKKYEMKISRAQNADISYSVQELLKEPPARITEGVLIGLNQVFDHALQQRERNQRISSESVNQPLPVDTFTEDFAVEAQNFATGLTQSVSFTTAAVALSAFSAVQSMPIVIVSAILGVFSIVAAFGTVANSSRYRNRNEEAQIEFFDTQLTTVKKGFFTLMTRDQRDKQPPDRNPFAVELTKELERFRKRAKYYGRPEADIDRFINAYMSVDKSITSGSNLTNLLDLMRRLLDEFIPVTFHENSYLQEDLVRIYNVMHERLDMLRQSHSIQGSNELFVDLNDFGERIGESLQRGAIQFGFLKERVWNQWAIVVSIRWLFRVIFCGCVGKSVTQQAGALLKKAKAVQKGSHNSASHFLREIRHLQDFYHASKESEIAAVLFSSALHVFVITILLDIFNLLNLIPSLNDRVQPDPWPTLVLIIQIWASITTLIAGLLAVVLLWKKQVHLVYLVGRLRVRARTDNATARVVNITWYQFWITWLRLFANLFSAVALVWFIVERALPQTQQSNVSSSNGGGSGGINNINGNSGGGNGSSGSSSSSSTCSICNICGSVTCSVWIALASIILVVFSTLLFFIMEFGVRYNLPRALGETVCQPSQKQLAGQYRDFRSSLLGLQAPDIVKRETWQYVAREFLSKYRFDTVFAADRFGTILQYLQSGEAVPDQVAQEETFTPSNRVSNFKPAAEQPAVEKPAVNNKPVETLASI